jgi:hypothetical protein
MAIGDDLINKAKGLFPEKNTGKKNINNFLGGKSNSGGGLTGKLAGMMGGFGNSAGGGGNDLAGGLGGLLGGGFPPGGDGGSGGNEIADALKETTSATGKEKPLFESKAAAKNDLKTREAKPPPKGSFMDETSSIGEPSAFGTTHVRPWVRNEFARREKNFGMYYTTGGEFANDTSIKMSNDAGFDEEYSETIYRGPKAPWMRVISNAIGKDPETELPIYGFEMHGFNRKDENGNYKNGFHEQYGFDPTTGQGGGKTYLGRGWTSEGSEKVTPPSFDHTIEEEDFKHRPSPGITSITSEDKEPGRNFRETTVNFVVHSRDQLDYMDDYFFKVGISCVVEWGWNTYPRECLLDSTNLGRPIKTAKGDYFKGNQKRLTKVNNLRALDEGKDPISDNDIDEEQEYRYEKGEGMIGMFTDPVLASNHLKKGKGNYSFAIGMISNYSYNLREDGGYDCEIKVTSMSKISSSLDNQATKEKKDEDGEEEDPDERVRDFKLFVETKLDEILGGDEDPHEWYDMGEDSIAEISGQVGAMKVSKGRFFQFDQSASGKETYHSDKEDAYITIGYLVTIINRFFSKKSKETNIGLFEFKVDNSRCVAHPNIKSTDGKVLLIPNAMSPRRNQKISERNSGTTDQVVSQIRKDLQLGNSDNASAVLAVINSELGKKLTNVNTALKQSPRDNLYEILSGYVPAEYPDAVKPFPDFATLTGGVKTEGYSGRIQDLYVNYNVIKDAVLNGSNITEMLKDILKKVSEAAGGIWDFDLVGPNTAVSNDNKVQIVDRRYPGLVTAYDIQKEDQAYRFKSHTKNSIVKSLSLDVSCAAEVQGMVLFGEEDAKDNPQAAFYARGREDRLLKNAKPKVLSKKPSSPKGESDDEEDEIESEEKFLVAADNDWSAFDYDIEMVDPNKNRVLKSMKVDDHKLNCVKNNMPLDGCELTMELDGIEGLRLLDVFACTGVPTHYFINGHWRIKSVAQNISDNNWITTIGSEYIPSVNGSG